VSDRDEKADDAVFRDALALGVQGNETIDYTEPDSKGEREAVSYTCTITIPVPFTRAKLIAAKKLASIFLREEDKGSCSPPE
jgi:hypothetical protein